MVKAKAKWVQQSCSNTNRNKKGRERRDDNYEYRETYGNYECWFCGKKNISKANAQHMVNNVIIVKEKIISRWFVRRK